MLALCDHARGDLDLVDGLDELAIDDDRELLLCVLRLELDGADVMAALAVRDCGLSFLQPLARVVVHGVELERALLAMRDGALGARLGDIRHHDGPVRLGRNGRARVREPEEARLGERHCELDRGVLELLVRLHVVERHGAELL
eukprot:Amastigsp_a508957_22.p2 type:complete len:144 gc:universal Amastigsp_a508957_22:2540-2109(-)